MRGASFPATQAAHKTQAVASALRLSIRFARLALERIAPCQTAALIAAFCCDASGWATKAGSTDAKRLFSRVGQRDFPSGVG
jgi:hypothetical protein